MIVLVSANQLVNALHCSELSRFSQSSFSEVLWRHDEGTQTPRGCADVTECVDLRHYNARTQRRALA